MSIIGQSTLPPGSGGSESGQAPPPLPVDAVADADPAVEATPVVEIGGREGPDPTRYGDWEKNGRCIDF